MSADRRQPDTSTARIGELREHAQLVASHMPGRLRLLRVRAGDLSIEVQWHDAEPAPAGAAAAAQPHALDGRTAAPGARGQAGEPAPDSGRVLVTAPIVGTFYQAPSPGTEPFVRVGDLVEPGQQVGIVEAMKLMNSVTADCAGRVCQVLAGDGEAVEFGQPLVAITANTDADALPVAGGPS